MKHDAPVPIHEPVPSVAAMIEHSVYDANQNAPEQTTTPSQQIAGGSGSGRTLARQSPITLMLGRMAEICE